MIGYMFAETSPVRAIPELRCDHLHCGEAFEPRGQWDRDAIRSAAARECGWTRDEVNRDHCGSHRSVYASQRMQAQAEATYPELYVNADARDVNATRPDLHAVTDPDDLAVARVTAAFEAAEQDERAACEYREAGALSLTPRRGRHQARTPLLTQLGITGRKTRPGRHHLKPAVADDRTRMELAA